MSKKQPPLKSTKTPLGSSLSGGFFWEKTLRGTYKWFQKLYGEPAPQNTQLVCVQSETTMQTMGHCVQYKGCRG